LKDRGGLWGLLVYIVAQKSADLIAYNRRLKRGGGKVRGHSAVCGKGAADCEDGFDRIMLRQPGPETLRHWADVYRRFLDCLGDAKLRRIAELSGQGYKIDEIANKLGLARRTIHRKLELIRKIWLAEPL
jgi:hypothetical protein